MKRTITALTLASILALTACEGGEQGNSRISLLHEEQVSLTDGRTVTCIVYKAGYAGGLSCDWENAK